ncbi:MAG: hypothetical protein ACRDQA_22245 [Nocardioidaceae bacterium]
MQDRSTQPPESGAPEKRAGATRARGMEVYKNEFAMVAIERAETDNGPRLHIVDLASDCEVFLDPIELEGLTRIRHRQFAPLLDPSDAVVADDPDPDQV